MKRGQQQQRQRDERTAWELAASAVGFSPLDLGAKLKAWLRNTVSSGPIASVTDLLAVNPATQVDSDRTPDGGENRVVTWDGSDVLTWPVTSANLGSASKWWLGMWIKPVNVGNLQIIYSTHSASASSARLELFISATGKPSIGVYSDGVTVRNAIATSNGALASSVPAFVLWVFDSDGATEADKCLIYVDNALVPLTFSGAGTITTLPVVTGNHIIGGRGDSDTPTVPLQVGSVTGQDTWVGTTAPTAAEMAALRAFNPIRLKNMVCLGNSITNGSLADAEEYPAVLQGLLGSSWTVQNSGLSGYTTPQLIADFATYVTPYFKPSGFHRNVLIVNEVGNDLISGTTEAAARANMQALIALGRSNGWRVYYATCMPRKAGGFTAGQLAASQAINAFFIANPAESDGVIDLAADSRLSDPLNTTYYMADGIHPTVAGAAAIADVAYQSFLV